MREAVSGVGTKYLVDTLNPTGLPQVLDETVNGAVTRTYAYGLQRISENQLNGSTWTPSFYGYDGHGNVRFLTNSTGTVTDTYQYDAFGRLIASTGSTPNKFLYSGEQFDSNVGLYNLRARYYNQGTGRFWTRDPAEGNLGLPQTLHKYLYVGGDPVMFRDPTGYEEAEEEAGALNIDITFTKHGAEHLVGTNVSRSEIEPIIEADMREILAGRQAPLGSLGREWWGYVQVQGIGFIYKVYIVSTAWLSVSSYYPE